MISKKMATLLNEQINMELFSRYLYLEIANYYEDQGLIGFAHWFTVQLQEEWDHAMLIHSYLLNNNIPIKLSAIGDPTTKFADHGKPLDKTLSHEQEITASIHRIYGVAQEEKDYRTAQFLDWFVMEQGEEEKNATDLVTKFKLFGDDAKSLYLLDQELATRLYAPPSLVLD